MRIIDYGLTPANSGMCGDVKESFTDKIGLARVKVKSPNAHYHKETTEYYIVITGTGFLKVNGQMSVLKPGMVARIDPLEVHQLINVRELVLEVISIPAWKEEDEYGA